MVAYRYFSRLLCMEIIVDHRSRDANERITMIYLFYYYCYVYGKMAGYIIKSTLYQFWLENIGVQVSFVVHINTYYYDCTVKSYYIEK